MAGVCRTCGFFEANVWPGAEKPHRCAMLDMPMTDHHANHFCPEHKDHQKVTKDTSKGKAMS